MVYANRTASLMIYNNGPFNGHELVQLYLSYPEAAKEPPKLLRGFERIYLDADDSEYVFFDVSILDMSIWDSVSH